MSERFHVLVRLGEGYQMDHLDVDCCVGETTQRTYRRRVPSADVAGGAMSESVAAFAHEIRTPLATINATLELLSYNPSPRNDDLRQLVARLQRGVTWIDNLVENLTTWSAMCDGVLSLDQSPTVVCEWIEQAMALVQPIIERREQTMLLACPEPAPIVVGDAFRLSQVMVNLLINASRYGAWGDTIAITVVDEGDTVVAHVSDHGLGIPVDECEKIFAPRVRGSQAAACADGQGLGLHIVAGIVARHGGTIGVDSVPGRGTTFQIRLPTEGGTERVQRA